MVLGASALTSVCISGVGIVVGLVRHNGYASSLSISIVFRVGQLDSPCLIEDGLRVCTSTKTASGFRISHVKASRHCVCMHAYIHTHACTHTNTYTFTPNSMHACMHPCMHVHVHIHIYICMHALIHTQIQTLTQILDICRHIHIQLHTCVQTCTQAYM